MTANLYSNNLNGWTVYNCEQFNEIQCTAAINKCHRDKHSEYIKSVGVGLVGIAASALVLSVALKVAQVTGILFALIFMSLSSIQPLYGMIIVGTGVAAGGWAAYQGLDLVFRHLFSHAKEHWAHASHNAKQAHLLELRQIELMKKDS